MRIRFVPAGRQSPSPRFARRSPHRRNETEQERGEREARDAWKKKITWTDDDQKLFQSYIKRFGDVKGKREFLEEIKWKNSEWKNLFCNEYPDSPKARWILACSNGDESWKEKVPWDDRLRLRFDYYNSKYQPMKAKRLLLEERISIVKERISPRMTESLLGAVGPEKLLATIRAISSQVGEGGEKRLAQIMKVMPSLDIQCHLMAERVSNHSRKPRKQDFFDVEHAIVGGAYADVFVTSDGNLFDLLTRRCRVSSDRGCRVARGVKGLEEALEQIDN